MHTHTHIAMGHDATHNEAIRSNVATSHTTYGGTLSLGVVCIVGAEFVEWSTHTMKQAFAKNDATDAARTIWRAEVQDAITTQIRVPFDVLCTPKYDFTRNIVELDIVTTVTLTDDEKADVATNYAASPELIPLATEARLSAKREAIAHRVANTARDLTARMPKAIAYVKAAHMFAVVARDFADELGTLAEFANDPRGAADALREVLSIGCVADAFGGVYQQARIAAK